MSRVSQLLKQSRFTFSIPACRGVRSSVHVENPLSLPIQHPALRSSKRFLDFYQIGNRKAIEKERARLVDEMNRGYFADMEEFKKHGGKIGEANKILVPATSAVKFPDLAVSFSDGTTLKLPDVSKGNEIKAENSVNPNVSLVSLSFRASSQGMLESWSKPFLQSFRDSKDVQLYEVSFIDSWFLCLNPIKHLLLRRMRKSNDTDEGVLRRQIVYSFGDHYYFRKELRILNLLTGYIFLLDKFGRLRWQGYGAASEEELSSLLSCTSLLLEEKQKDRYCCEPGSSFARTSEPDLVSEKESAFQELDKTRVRYYSMNTQAFHSFLFA